MRIAHYVLITSVLLGVVGFVVAALLDEKQLGMAIFYIGFFAGAVSAVSIVLTRAGSDFGKLGVSIKIAAGGFGVIVLGQLLGFLLGSNGLIENIFFFVGIAVMVIGIVIAALRMAKF